MKKILCLTIVAIALTGCQSTPSPESTVDAYLEAIKKGEPRQQQELSCHQKESAKPDDPLVDIQKWEIVEQEPKTSETDSDGKYQLVSAKIESKTLGNFTVTRTWKFSVWKTDDFFESNKRFFDKWNRKGAEMNAILRETQKALGEKPVDASKPVVAERSDYSPKRYCILRLVNES